LAGITVQNNSSDTSAAALYVATNDQGGEAIFGMLSSGYAGGAFGNYALINAGTPASTTVEALAINIEASGGVLRPIYFAQNAQQGGSNKMTIGSNGFVGIASDEPTSRLTVAGTMETTLGGVKFPDGTIQTTAAGAGGVTGISSQGATPITGAADIKAGSNAVVTQSGQTIEVAVANTLTLSGSLDVTGMIKGAGVMNIYHPAIMGVHNGDGSNNNCDSWNTFEAGSVMEQWNVIDGLSDGQDIDIVYQIQVPYNFTTWESTSLKVHYKVSDTSKNVTVYVYDTGGTLRSTSTPGQSATEADITISYLAGTFTPGETFIVLCKGAVDTNDFAYVGWVKGWYD
ncbi:MAG: hypothetical protein KJ732_01995, partial [Candidatus Margulisbacteria bacterium]|nr:hypothetical protein [Candidatus Margulisiibacteriota bacterium]